MDAQSVKTVEESAHISEFDGHQRVKGREALICATDTLGIPMSYSVTPANMHDTRSGLVDCWPGSHTSFPGSRRSELTKLTRGQELARDGARHKGDGTSKWLSTRPALTD